MLHNQGTQRKVAQKMKTYKTQGTCSRAIEFETADGVLTACRFIVSVLPLVFSSGAGCESRQRTKTGDCPQLAVRF